MKELIRCLRLKHYIKNLLIFVPFFFGIMPVNYTKENLRSIVCGFFVFGFTSSIIYIINDWNDRFIDKQHPKKSKRPIAAGKVNVKKLIIFCCFLLCMIILLSLFAEISMSALILLLAYFVLNILYSKILKNIEILDIVVLSLFYIIRVYYGGALVHIEVSHWLYLTVHCLALYLSAGKRMGELKAKTITGISTRYVLKHYSIEYLKSIMLVFLIGTIVFYSLWTVLVFEKMAITIPVVIFTLMRYQYDVEMDFGSDPTELVYEDKWIVLMILVYVICISTVQF